MQFLTLFVEELAAKNRLLQNCLQFGEGQKKLQCTLDFVNSTRWNFSVLLLIFFNRRGVDEHVHVKEYRSCKHINLYLVNTMN